VGGRWVGSHGPAGRCLWLMQSSVPLEHGPGVHEGHGPSGVEIVHVCGSLVLKALRVQPGRGSAGLYKPEGCSLAEIVNVCGSLAWQALGVQSGGDHCRSCRFEGWEFGGVTPWRG
jgi:hypothetical protein